MKNIFNLLIINPGSTSTKVAFFKNNSCISSKTLYHSSEELDKYNSITEQYVIRKQAIMEYLSEQGITPQDLAAVVGRGGLLKPLKGGTYRVNSLMLEHLERNLYGQHASNLGAILANEIASAAGIPAYIVNPVVVDELEPLARFSGLPEIPRKSAFHALNQKAMAMKACKELCKKYEEANLIVAHLGGGISVAAHCKGKVIDVNNGLEEGPFSPERTGSLPVLQLLELCYSGKYAKDELKKKLVGKGGLVAYLGTSDGKEIEDRIAKGDVEAELVLKAMAYQIAKEIASQSAVLFGMVDAIVITGGLARMELLVNWITERVKFISVVKVYPGEDEMSALGEGALRVLSGEEEALIYY